MTVRPLFAAGSLVTVLLAATACDLAAEPGPSGTFERTLTIRGLATIDIGTGSGRIEVTRGGDDRVHVIGRIHSSPFGGRNMAERIRRIEQSPPIEQDAARIRIGRTGNDPLYSGLSLSYEVRVPAGTAVRASTGSGSIDVGDAAGGLVAHTGSGSIDARGVGGVVEARTGSGSIALEGRPAGDWTVAAGSGSVRLALPPDAAFVLRAQTGSGSITTSHPLTVADAISRRRLRGDVRGGGPTIQIVTGSGSIRVE